MYLVYGTITYSTAANRNSALSAINNALLSYSATGVTTAFPSGVNTSGTAALTVSLQVPDHQVEGVNDALRTAWTSVTRATTGHYIATVKK